MRCYAMPVPRKLPVVAAFVALCVIWSSTWLAIKIGLRDLPPVSFVAMRFVIAVVVLLAISIGRVRLLPARRRDFFLLAYTGVLMFWAQDRSRKQEDTLALLDESMAMFAGWLQREDNREMKGGEDSCPQP